MNPRFVGMLIFTIIICCLATGAVVYPQLPAVFASHWNAAGVANGSMSKFWGVLMMPLIMLLLAGLWALLPRIDPVAPGFKGFRYAYDFFFFLVVSFFAYAYALMLRVNLGLQQQILPMILPALAVLIFALGAMLPLLKRNWFIGIRTPWTISSDSVWNKTHRLGSRLFEIASVFILAAAFVPPAVSLWLVLGSVGSAALASVIYSYVVFRAEQK